MCRLNEHLLGAFMSGALAFPITYSSEFETHVKKSGEDSQCSWSEQPGDFGALDVTGAEGAK